MADERDRRRYPFPESSRPLDAPGGIKAHSRRGAFGRTWWGRRWLEVLERLDLGGRLSRARAYARRGQVLDVAIDEGRVTASVQGSRKDPYAVTIRVAPLGPAAWRKAGDALRREARFAAKLLASEMPDDVEEAFTRAGVSLFPETRRELDTACSCPDWSNPCKHIAAVYYLLGEEFDRDPFLLFRLRGLTREGLVRLLGSVPAARPPARVAAEEASTAEPAVPSPSLGGDTQAFWSGAALPPPEAVEPPGTSAAILARLGPFPFWRGREPLVALLAPVYDRASTRALEVYAGAAGPPRGGPDAR